MSLGIAKSVLPMAALSTLYYTVNHGSGAVKLWSGRLLSGIAYATVGLFFFRMSDTVLKRGVVTAVRDIYGFITKTMFSLVKTVPGVSSLVNKEIVSTLAALEHSLISHTHGERLFTELPDIPLTVAECKAELQRHLAKGADSQLLKPGYELGKVSGAVYHAQEDIYAVILDAITHFIPSNPLHPDLFPGVRQMEAEVISMAVGMFHGKRPNSSTEDDDDIACGTTTSGGTESILMAVKTYRDKAFTEKRVADPEILAPVTVHAAFEKAAHYFGVRLIHIPVDEVTFKCRLDLMEKSITNNTILLVGSAPNFPTGIMDDIEGISALALRRGIPCHVDCCLGGFILPFMDSAGYPMPLFDFRLPGVTSISCDPHKYGFAPKGSSVILYQNKRLRRFQYFVTTDWTGGTYCTAVSSGSRPGSLIAGCWASMIHIGKPGYISSTKSIVTCARRIAHGLRSIDGIIVYGEPLATVVAFGSKKYNIYTIDEELSKLGWNLNKIQNPSGIHICCTLLTVGHELDFVEDVRKVVAEVSKRKNDKPREAGIIYGMAATLPDRSIIKEIVAGYLDILFKV